MSSATVQRESGIPHVSGVINRPRLLNRLRAAVDHKLTLICAPPGYGKTTIAAQFAVQTPHVVAWHTLNERERDIPNLYNQALTTLAHVAPGIQNLAPVPGYTPSELATLIADYLRENTYQQVLYILDDTHVLAGAPAAEIWLQTFVALLPPNCHVVLIGRILPNLPLTEMIARGEVLALGQEQLRFTNEEIYNLAQGALGTPPSMAEVEELAARLEGWPAGTVLALYPLPADLEQVMLRGGKGPEALFNALAGSMLEAQPPGLRDFLLASSTLFRMTPELCSTVLELPDSAYWLTEAQNRSLFLSKVSGGLVYHRLFRDFLQQELRRDNLSLFASLHTKVARWFEEHDQIDESFEHYMIAGLIERAAAIAERVAQVYFSQGKVETLIEWRSQLGQIGIFAPGLLYNCARVHTDRYSYEEAEAALDEAERGFMRTGNEIGQADVQLQRAFIHLQQGEPQRAAFEAATLADSVPAKANLRGRALKILGVAHLRLGEVVAAVKYLEQALTLHRQDGDAYALANVLQDLGVAYLRLKRLGDASACLQEVVALRRSLGSAGALAGALNNLGFYYHLGGNYEQALSTLQEGLSIVARVPNRRVESALLWSMGELRRDQGAFEESLRLHNRALELIGNSDPWLRCAVLVSASTLRRWQAHPHESALLAEKALVLANAHDAALERATAKAALWAARAQLGEAARARAHLEDVHDDLRDKGAHSELVWVFALSAQVALLCGDQRNAEQYLQRAVTEAEESGSLQRLVAEIVHTPTLDEYVSAHSASYSTLLKHLKHLRAAQEKRRPAPRMPATTSQDTFSLRVVTLGREHIERDGDIVPPSDWRSNTAREMFLYLLFNGAQNREQISLFFWPDSPPKRVRSNFHTTLYRARQALGENVIEFRDGLYFINPEIDLWCDAQEMETLTQQARLLPSRDARTEDMWRRAVELYQGDFLPSWDAEWVIYRREDLLEAYIEALIGMGNCARARSDLREALATYRRALDADPYREDVHRAIMICYAESGEKKQVLDHLQKLQALLRADLAIDPSAETISLADELLTG